jgi:tRNA-uridine 2-sulfurtransferase
MTNKLNENKVLLAMSGGTDSSVAAILLKNSGYNIVGMTFRAYDSIREECLQKETGCCSIDAIYEAKNLADKLGFEHHIIDVRDQFDKTVIKNFIQEYIRGATPNPCVVCNTEIKWGRMIEEADRLGCKYLATGHYAQIEEFNSRFFIRRGFDVNKDQSYFLWNIPQSNLNRTIFPLGKLTKPQVREIAEKHGFMQIATKPESQEICFIPNNDYRKFLSENVNDINTIIGQGDYIDENGKFLGKHKGFAYYTIGQRKGLDIALGYPAYVLKINSETNTIVLGPRESLKSDSAIAGNINFMKIDKIPDGLEVQTKIRYNTKAAKSCIKLINKELHISFLEDVFAVTPGQSVVCYQGDDIICGGIIKKKN